MMQLKRLHLNYKAGKKKNDEIIAMVAKELDKMQH